jgi:hypothetical protein
VQAVVGMATHAPFRRLESARRDSRQSLSSSRIRRLAVRCTRPMERLSHSSFQMTPRPDSSGRPIWSMPTGAYYGPRSLMRPDWYGVIESTFRRTFCPIWYVALQRFIGGGSHGGCFRSADEVTCGSTKPCYFGVSKFAYSKIPRRMTLATEK